MKTWHLLVLAAGVSFPAQFGCLGSHVDTETEFDIGFRSATAGESTVSDELVGPLLWSDPTTWGGSPPVAGDTVTIPEGAEVILDQDTPALAGMTIEGTLIFDAQDLHLTSGWILVDGGTLQIGSAEAPHEHQAVITLDAADTDQSIEGMGTRALLVRDGSLLLHGSPPAVPWTRLDQHAPAGATSLTLETTVEWEPGDRIVIAPTDFYGIGETEEVTMASVSGTSIELDGPLADSRWGVLQHVSHGGMSSSEDPAFAPPAEPSPTVLDERAEVGNLSRNIVIEGADDALWQTQGFGAQVMIMGLASTVEVDGVEIRRAGQAGRMGRYPFHWHMLSYDSTTGEERGDAVGHVLRNSVISDSANRCVVIHGTNGTEIRDNICHSIRGHAFMLEDAVERRTVLEGNLVLRVRNPKGDELLQQHESDIFQGGSSGYWITNPDNTVHNNVAADCEGNGFWLSFPSAPLGTHAAVEMQPNVMHLGVFSDNRTHSNNKLGMTIDWSVIDAEGNVAPLVYMPMVDELPAWNPSRAARALFSRFVLYKNNEGGLWNRVTMPDYEEFVAADNAGTYFDGSGADGLITRGLVVGTSLNSANPSPGLMSEIPVAFATYHSTFAMQDNTVVGFPYVSGTPSGVFRTDDYYIRPVDRGLARNTGNLLIDTQPGYRSPPPAHGHSTLAGALEDANGYWGPAGNYWVYDDPFFSEGLECEPVAPAGDNGLSCDGTFYGALEPQVDQSNPRYDARMAMAVTRVDQERDPIGTPWVILDGDAGYSLPNMRHFAMAREGIYTLRFPDNEEHPFDVGLTIENAYRADDVFVLGIHFSGEQAANVLLTTYYNYEDFGVETPSGSILQQYASVASFAELLASNGATYYQDTADNLVWVKYHNDIEGPFDGYEDFTEEGSIYKPRYLRVYPTVMP